MSAKKNWDIAPKSRVKTAPAPLKAQEPKPRPPERVTSMRRAPIKREPTEPLKKRRRNQRRLWLTLGVILLLLVIAGIFALAWQPYLRVTGVRIEGSTNDQMQREIEEDLKGSIAFVIPRNSLFFVPQEKIRADILKRHPEVQSVALHVENLHTLVVETNERQDVFVWCGLSKETRQDTCYKVDAEGMLFAPTFDTASYVAGTLIVYAALDADTPLSAHIQHPELLPTASRFIKVLRDMGMDITTLVIRADEADLYTKAGTRITYVLGREEAAAALAASALMNVPVNDGTIEYVDLRFTDKVYVKKYSEAAP